MRSVRNPKAHAIGNWSVRDVAAHLLDVVEDHQNVARGNGTAVATSEEIGPHNQRLVEARAETDVAAIAERYEREMAAYVDYLDGVDGDPIVSWADIKIPLSTVIAADIAECLMHGFDITNAEGRPWHIDPRRAALSSKGISPMTMNYVDKENAAGVRAAFDLRLRGQWQLHFLFDDGELSIEEPANRPIDVHISADPVAFMLVGYGRASQWGPLLKGKIVAYGRKPWLAMRFGSLLRNP
jgi:uncharacterized protein (TIGR03083 family)